MPRKSHWFIVTLAGMLAMPLSAQEETPETPAPVSLAELASAADLIAVVRVADTDYEYTRQFPTGGTAFLQILIPYKVSRPLPDIIEVYEEGLRAGECYFENPTVLEEGRRHLVFLKFSEEFEDQYNGLAQGCRLDVLVTSENTYALRFPLNGIELSDDLASIVQPIDYADANAVFDFEGLNPEERIELQENGYLGRDGGAYKYTHGVALSEVRKLMGPEALTLDRSLRQTQPPPEDQETIR